MKGLSITIAICLAIVCGTIIYNNLIEEKGNSIAEVDFNIDLNQNDNLDDLIFDKDGHLLAGTTYKWNYTNDTKGEAIATLQLN